MNQEFQIPIDARVRLIDGVDYLYPVATARSEGFIRKRKFDAYGFPMIWIEWDKEHWGYNGESDGWTFEGHFEITEKEKDEMDRKKLASLLVEGLSGLVDQAVNPPPKPKPKARPKPRPQRVHEEETPPQKVVPVDANAYLERVNAAHEEALEGEAFVTISVTRDGDDLIPNTTVGIQNNTAAAVLDLHMAIAVANAYQYHAMRRLKESKD